MAKSLRIFAVICMLSLFASAFSFPFDNDFLFGGFSNHQQQQQQQEQQQSEERNTGFQVGFYEQTCPRAEEIVKDHMTKAFQNDSGLAAAVIRLHSHDCFVNGCDGSVLLDATPGGGRVEKEAPANGKTVRGFELIDEVKADLERECPGVVSCADVLAFLSRDALVLSGLPEFDLPAGRRDGKVSREDDAVKNLASPNNTVDQMLKLFEAKGLDQEDLVALLGVHSIGVAHCYNFRYRLRDRKKAKDVDGSVRVVMGFQCLNNPSNTVPMDSTTQYKLDSGFYKQLLQKKALLESDGFLATDKRTKPLVERFADNQNDWLNKFTQSVIKMGQIQLLTGDQGEIRRNCRFVN